jgi:DNA invertase Pin-like site-specific DNA recombinase
MKVWGYGRHSTDDQDITERAQQQSVSGYIKRTFGDEVESSWSYDAAVSGGKSFSERPEARGIYFLAQPGDYVVVSKLDRAFRDLEDSIKTVKMFQAKGITFKCVDQDIDFSDPYGKAFSRSQTVFAELERDVGGARTSVAMQELKAEGKPYGPYVPYGWKKVGSNGHGYFLPDEAERKQINLLLGMRKEHQFSYEKLEQKNCRTQRTNGRKWNRNTIRKAFIAREKGYPKRMITG